METFAQPGSSNDGDGDGAGRSGQCYVTNGCSRMLPSRPAYSPVIFTFPTEMFRYDIVTLIELIKNRPCLWDKTLDTFKDRSEKQKAWEEICAVLEKTFHKKDKHEQKRICDLINGKWQNVRDAFVKSLKKQSTQPNCRRYLYHERLQFLMKILHKEDGESYLHDTPDETQAEAPEETDAGKSNEECSPRKKPRLQEDIDQEILKALRRTKTAPDEDEAFFISIIPTVRKMSEEDKLEFRMGVLQLIKDINSRGKDISDSVPFFSPVNTSSSSHPSTSFSHYSNPNSDCGSFNQETHLFKCE